MRLVNGLARAMDTLSSPVCAAVNAICQLDEVLFPQDDCDMLAVKQLLTRRFERMGAPSNVVFGLHIELPEDRELWGLAMSNPSQVSGQTKPMLGQVHPHE